MGKHGISMKELEQKKADAFLNEIRPWIDTLPNKDVRFAYYTLLIYMAGKVPLADHDQVIEKAKTLYKQTNR